MHHALFVCVLQSDGCLTHVIASCGDGQRPAVFDHVGKFNTIHVLHHQEMSITRLFGVEGGDDVGMRQPRRRLHLAMKSLHGGVAVDQLGVHDFQSHRPVHHAMMGFVDVAHAAPAKNLRDAITTVIAERVGKRQRTVFGSCIGNFRRAAGRQSELFGNWRQRGRDSRRTPIVVGRLGLGISQQRHQRILVRQHFEQLATRFAVDEMLFDLGRLRDIQLSGDKGHQLLLSRASQDVLVHSRSLRQQGLIRGQS